MTTELTDIAEARPRPGRRRRAGRGHRRPLPRHRDPGLRGRGREADRGRVGRASASGSSKDGRQGFAYAGSLDADVIAEVLTEARDNAAFGDADEANGVAEPDGVAPTPALDVYRPGLADVPTADKIDLALAARAGHPGRRLPHRRARGRATTRTAPARSSWPRPPASARPARRPTPTCRPTPSPSTATRSRPATGSPSVRDPSELDVDACAAEVARRATPAARRRRSRRRPGTTVVLDPFVTAQFLDILGFALSAENLLKGRSLFADRIGDEVASPLITLTEDPTDARRHDRHRGRRRGPGHPAHPAARRRASSRASSTTATRPAAWARRRPVRRCGASSTPHVGTRALAVTPGTVGFDELVAGIDDGVLIRGVSGLHSGVNPDQRRLLHRRRRAADQGRGAWPSRSRSSPSRRRCRRCSTTWPPWVPTSPGCPCRPPGSRS